MNSFAYHFTHHLTQRARPIVLASLAALAACGTPESKVSEATEPALTASAPAPSRAKGPLSNADHMDDYKRDIAAWISQRNSKDIYAGQPQALLRGIVVLSIHVDGDGAVQTIRMLRGPGDRELEQRAMQSVWRASPLPRPTRALASGRSIVGFSETWLFNNDGRFQLRSVALEQKRTNF